MYLVSCIVPTHNRAMLLKRALTSVINQTYKNLEIIVINDASIDNTKEIINDFQQIDSRIVPIHNRVSKGRAMSARNCALRKINGEYVAFLDDDDEWLSEKIESQIPYADKYSMISCLPYIVYKHGITPMRSGITGNLEMDVDYILSDSRYVFPTGILMKSKYFKYLNGFDETVPEWDFFIRATKSFGPALLINEHLVKFDRAHQEKRVSQTAFDNNNKFKIIERYKKLFPKKILKKRYGQLYLKKGMLEKNFFNKAISFIFSIKYDHKNIFRIIKYILISILKIIHLKQ